MAFALLLFGLLGVLPAAAETGRIAFMSTRDGTWAVYAMSQDASARTRLTFGDDRDCAPAWSPDGARIAFVSYRDGSAPEIYAMSADGSGQTRLTANAAWDGTPAWSGAAEAGPAAAVVRAPGGDGVPTDTDDEGAFDDTSGNGRKDFADVVLYFNQLSWVMANEPVTAFDYNANGRIDFADVVWLFNHL